MQPARKNPPTDALTRVTCGRHGDRSNEVPRQMRCRSSRAAGALLHRVAYPRRTHIKKRLTRVFVPFQAAVGTSTCVKPVSWRSAALSMQSKFRAVWSPKTLLLLPAKLSELNNGASCQNMA